MNNPRITPKDRNAIKGALRRAFSRSALRKEVIDAAVVEHFDEFRPRVKTWFKCAICAQPEAKSYAVVDHISPLIPIHLSFQYMNLEDVVDRLWCHISNLQALCPECHDKKTKAEKEQRKQHKKRISK